MLLSEKEYFPEGKVFHGSVPLVMGTKLELLVCGEDEPLCNGLWENMCSEAQRLDAVMNRFSPESEVSRLNAAGGGLLTEEMAGIIALCEHFRKSTCGLFDIGRGTVDWSSAFPKEKGSSDGTPVISLGGGNLDFGGFGKGFLLKKYKEMLKEAGVSSAYADFGGSSILAVGHHPFGPCWKVGVTDPFTGTRLRELELIDMAMSTSGNQPGYDGHITDPRDGSRICGRKMFTIISTDPLTAETVSTAAMIANAEELDYIRKNNDIAEILDLSAT